jgi:anaphase-promoting complex subunit 8
MRFRAAELLDSLPDPADAPAAAAPTFVHPAISPNTDSEEATLEQRELNKYLLAKSLFDCKEYDRCAAVFLPDNFLSGLLSGKPDDIVTSPKGKGKAAAAEPPTGDTLPEISQKSLFLALYAKVISGEKKRDEDTEMVMGPQDLGSTVNKQLLVVSRFLEIWFAQHTSEDGEVVGSQGFLEYLYGMVLAKEKNEAAAMDYLVRSVHQFPMNWGCWLEMTNLISRVEHVSCDRNPGMTSRELTWTDS